MPRAWLTPDNLPVTYNCWQVLIPDSIELEAVFRGALLELARVENWEKNGAVEPIDCADFFWDGLDTSLEMIPCESGGTMTIPIGTVYWFAGSGAPSGSLVCDGGEYSTALYPELYAAIGFAWGGSGSMFNVPDLVGNCIIGVGGSYALGDTGGEETHTLTLAEMPQHSHNLWVNNANGTTEFTQTLGKTLGTTTLTGANGDGDAHNNMQPYAAMTPCIVAQSV